MKWLKALVVVVLVVISLTVIAFFERDPLFKELLIKPLQKELLLPQSFWQETNIKFFWQAPYRDFWSDKNVIRDGTVLPDKESGKDVIHLNFYVLTELEYSFQKRISIIKEVLAHETGHVLYGMAVSNKVYELKRQFRKELGEKFKEQRVDYFGITYFFPNPWEYRSEEAFADIARMSICPSCKQQPETAITMTPQLKDLTKQIIDISLNQK